MKTSLSHLFATAALACVLSAQALAASPVTSPAEPIPPTSTGQRAPAGSALPPGTLPTDPTTGNGADASGSSIRPKTMISPDIEEQHKKDSKAQEQIRKEQDRNESGNQTDNGSPAKSGSGDSSR